MKIKGQDVVIVATNLWDEKYRKRGVVRVTVGSFWGEGGMSTTLTPTQARHVARSLNQAADKVLR